MTQGWQNLAVERHRIRGRENILFEIQRVHPTAFATEVGSDLAYWIGTVEQPRLIGIAWKASEDSDSSWCYACMNEIAVELGSVCTLIHQAPPKGDGKNVIVPGSMPGVYGVVNGLASSVMDAIAVAGRFKGEPEPDPEPVRAPIELKTLAAALQAPGRVVKARAASDVKKRVYRDRGQWWVWVETKTHAKQLGPFPNRDAAAKAKV